MITNNENLAWLAGIIDGEGSIGIKRAFDTRKNRSFVSYSPLIQICNTDMILLTKVIEILEFHGITFSFWNGSEKKRNPKWSVAYMIGISKNQSAMKFLELLIPFLVSKKQRAEILYEFCLKRQAYLNDRHTGGGNLLGKFKKAPDYSGFWWQIHSLNAKGKRYAMVK